MTGRPLLRGRFSQEEVVTALDAASGKTMWEHRYPSPTGGRDFTEGAGPHATPLIVGNRLFAVGSRREFFALDKATGKVLWSHDFIKEYGAAAIDRGMANSPLLYNNTIMCRSAASGQAVGAFNPETGALVWKAGDVEYAPASPILIDVDGQTQLVVFGGDRIAGMDPANGRDAVEPSAQDRLGPQHQHADLVARRSPADLFVGLRHRQPRARAAPGGRQDDGRREVGAQPRARAHRHHHPHRRHAPTCRAATSVRRFSPRSNVKTGAMAWQDRALRPRAAALCRQQADRARRGRHARPRHVSPQGLKVLARAPILENLAWTPPTLVGTTLYVRDRKTIAAYDLG